MSSFIKDLPLLWNIVIFILSGALVWGAGVRLSKYADRIIDKTGVSEVFIGTLGLAVITSLPEVATTLSATLANNVSMAINNLFGSIALQITVLAVGDYIIKHTSLSGSLENPVSRLQAICLSFLLALAAVAILYEDVAFFHIGIWSVVLFAFYVILFYIINYFKKMKWWLTEPEERESIGKVKAIVSERIAEQEESEDDEQGDSGKDEKVELSSILTSRLGLYTLLAALGILAGGYFVANSADVIAQETGIGSSFMGYFFVGLTTSLPELSTTISAAKLKRYRMAFSNIFGTNLLNVGLVLLADLLHTEGPALNEVGNFAAAGAVFGILLTSIYQIGLTIKFKKTVFRLGIDSIFVVLFYIIGTIILFNMRNL
ncbi:sodium/calcium exchanger membrane protein [Flammeovirgaceae bacterium 311]|nr:sodium/calcium exchanger membrane protein [Flammeovirgaceae bacterium 311]